MARLASVCSSSLDGAADFVTVLPGCSVLGRSAMETGFAVDPGPSSSISDSDVCFIVYASVNLWSSTSASVGRVWASVSVLVGSVLVVSVLVDDCVVFVDSVLRVFDFSGFSHFLCSPPSLVEPASVGHV